MNVSLQERIATIFEYMKTPQFGEWVDATILPEFTIDEGWARISEPVLVFDGHKRRIAFVQQLEDESNVQWISDCSEGWILKNVKCWMPLPPLP